jgi:hypothetical protein
MLLGGYDMKRILTAQTLMLIFICAQQYGVGFSQQQRQSGSKKSKATSGGTDTTQTIAFPNPALHLKHVNPQNFRDIVIHLAFAGDPPEGVHSEEVYFRSLDGGQTWQRTQFNQHSNLDTLWPYGFYPFTPLVLYRFAPGDYGQLSVSKDSGPWYKIEPNVDDLESRIQDKRAQVVALDPHDVNTLYIAVFGDRYRKSYGLFKSVDGGHHFRRINFKFDKLWISPLQRNLMYAWRTGEGIYRSTDDGQHWKKTAPHEFVTKRFEDETIDESGRPIVINVYPFVRQIAFDSSNADALYVITTEGILKTTNGGKAWEPLDIKLPLGALDSAEMIVNPKDGRQLYLTSNYDLRRSDDGGKTWRILPTPKLEGPPQ